MAITAYSQWSTTAASNIDLNSIPLSDSMLANQIDGAFQELMAQLATAALAPIAGPTFTGILTHAGQIKFPAVVNPSSDANTLDDYEELNDAAISQASGISAGSGTFTSASGTRSYTKIGRQVTVTWDITITTIGTATTSTVLTLPFTAAAAGGRWAGVGRESVANTAVAGTITEGASTAVIPDAGGWMGSGIGMIFTITYWV